MTTASQQRVWSQRYRRANMAREAARARRWRAGHPNYAGKYVAIRRGTAVRCNSGIMRQYAGCCGDWHFTDQCRNLTRHESGLCWRHRAGKATAL